MNHKPRAFNKMWLLALLVGALLLTACSGIGNMQDQRKLHKPYEESENFETASRDLDPNAVPIGFLREDEHFYTGRVDGELVTTFPMELTEEFIYEGQRQYEAFCAPCHGYGGYGDGVVAQEGFPVLVSYHSEASRQAPVGHFFEVITYGQGLMYSYASRIAPEERWAIVAYIRALQMSQNAELADLPDDVQGQFDAMPVEEVNDDMMTDASSNETDG